MWLCPRQEATCQRHSIGARNVVNSFSVATEAISLRLRMEGAWEEGQERHSKTGECGLRRATSAQSQVCWLNLLAPDTVVQVSQLPLPFIEDLKAALRAPETVRHSLPSAFWEMSSHHLPFYHVARLGEWWWKKPTLNLFLSNALSTNHA